MKNVNKATPEYATSETLVWWDMDSCPLPNGYDPSRLGPRIDTELKNLGYNGPLTIIAVGNVDGIPYDFLKVLSSNGFVIKHSGQDIHGDMREYFISRSRLCQPPPVTIMIISGLPLLLESVTREIYVRPDCGYNLLLAYPPHSEPKQPHPSWLWDRASLLKGSSNVEKRRLDKGSVIPFSCGLCYFFCPSFEHQSPPERQACTQVEEVGEVAISLTKWGGMASPLLVSGGSGRSGHITYQMGRSG
ncbi:hypothetical protein Bca4012_088359 [Brassica carinata]